MIFSSAEKAFEALQNNLLPLPMQHADVECSQAIQQLHPPTAKECWRNALLGGYLVSRPASDRPSLPPALANTRPLAYVEGYISLSVGIGGAAIPIQHGWLESAEGVVIEPTLQEQVGYFAAARYPLRSVIAAVSESEGLLLPLTSPSDMALAEIHASLHCFGSYSVENGEVWIHYARHASDLGLWNTSTEDR